VWAAIVAVAVLTLTSCTGAPPRPVQGSTVSVAVSAPLTSLNAASATGNQATDIGVAALTGSAFTSYDSTADLVANSQLGSITKLSDKPLRVKYTVNESVKWSDGASVDAADLLLSWAAGSGVLNTVKPARDAAGAITNQKELLAGVYFDSAGAPGLDRVTRVPRISDDKRSITMTFDAPDADWQRALVSPLIPAHVVMREAFPARHYSADAAKRALVRALQEFDRPVLTPVSAFWSHGFEVDGSLPRRALRVTNGPYTITALTAGTVTLSANPHYRWGTRPGFEKVVVRVIADPLEQTRALRAGTVDVISAVVNSAAINSATHDAVENTHGATVASVRSGVYEHLDLTFNNAGPFDASRYGDDQAKALAVRAAFLATIPRSAILSAIARPLGSAAVERNSFLAMPGTDGYSQITKANGSRDQRGANISTARKLLADAGISGSIPVRLLFPAGDALRTAEFELIARSAAQAGFAVSNVSVANWQAQLGSGGYDAALFAWAAHDLTVAGTRTVFERGGSRNVSGYASRSVDGLFATQASALDRQARIRLSARIDTRLFADAYGVPLFQYPLMLAQSGVAQRVTTSPLPPGVFGTLASWSPRGGR
jgi:peptide/nickel transport system substrate-binding protein